jgi:glycosyltransferase involved in cell wall biosynthesis
MTNTTKATANSYCINPMISVIMATYNRERYIRAALESILKQSYTNMEIIVIDDGSTDRTPDVITALMDDTGATIHYVQQQNRGQASALNHGLRLAHGSIIAFLDSDDLWPEDRLPFQLSFIMPNDSFDKGPGIVLGHKEHFADGVPVNIAELAAANRRSFHYCLSSSLFARWVFDVVGWFDETPGYHVADWDWFVRAREAGISMVSDPRTAAYGRIHDGNITRNRELLSHLTVTMLKKHLDRMHNNTG